MVTSDSVFNLGVILPLKLNIYDAYYYVLAFEEIILLQKLIFTELVSALQ